MTREDIGNYLGLTFETVSRSMSKLQADKLIQVHNRDINLLNIPRIREIVALLD